MSLKNILTGLGRRILRGKKESATPATGQQQKQITFEGKVPQETGQELAVRELRNPPVILNKTQPLHMGDKTAPAFGSSTYDWVMRKGRGQYTADEWLDHLTSSRQINFKVFGKPSKTTVLDTKKFKYDSGPFAGKEVNVSREELFDSNLAIFDRDNNLTGGLLYAAKQFGLKLDANTVGAMLKLNPVNRIKVFETGIPARAAERTFEVAKKARVELEALTKKYPNISELRDARYHLNAVDDSGASNAAINDALQKLRSARDEVTDMADYRNINRLIGEISESNRGATGITKPKYYDNDQTLRGGQNYREHVFFLDEPIKNSTTPLDAAKYGNGGTHFGGVGPVKNEIFHVRTDIRFTPDGKKVITIQQIQADRAKTVSENLSKIEQLAGEKRKNPFQAELIEEMFTGQQAKLQRELQEALRSNNTSRIYRASDDLKRNSKRIVESAQRGEYDYLPMVDGSEYNDHALKYLMQLAAKEKADYVAVIPFDKIGYKASSKIAGNELNYGYASGAGVGKKGKAVLPQLMKKNARFYNTQAGPIKISYSPPSKPYKRISTDEYTYRDTRHPLYQKTFKRPEHREAITKEQYDLLDADDKSLYQYMEPSDPGLYFDAFAIKISPLMRNTQKTYKSEGGLVEDVFKPIRYN